MARKDVGGIVHIFDCNHCNWKILLLMNNVIIVNNIIIMIIIFLVYPKVKLAISVIEPYGDNIYISAVTQNIIVTQFILWQKHSREGASLPFCSH